MQVKVNLHPGASQRDDISIQQKMHN